MLKGIKWIVLDKCATILTRSHVVSTKTQREEVPLLTGATFEPGATIKYNISHFPQDALARGYKRYDARVAAMLAAAGVSATRVDKGGYVTYTVEGA